MYVDFGRLVRDLQSFKRKEFLYVSLFCIRASFEISCVFERGAAQKPGLRLQFSRGIVTFLGAGWSHFVDSRIAEVSKRAIEQLQGKG